MNKKSFEPNIPDHFHYTKNHLSTKCRIFHLLDFGITVKIYDRDRSGAYEMYIRIISNRIEGYCVKKRIHHHDFIPEALKQARRLMEEIKWPDPIHKIR